ncbi:FtsW/RodA/SpoVE family cell cycle protein [Dellaglioa algida]|uniref:FtsW/RodA/SpoVE family cell cycle protein n=1 Tax=Dellaglioa algida TaxID=105612 RepID=UPI0024C49734|nr:FtsW/RodA/SpoVE family cell cycle protein [Dellaglioa algida]MDK1726199.1 FtsW/RodA/SpoVE family cell cycle protein [Dellaglioa algida]
MQILKRMTQKLQYLDYYIFIPYLILSGIGVVMVYSASSYKVQMAGGDPTTYLKKQLLFAILGLMVVFFIYAIKVNFFKSSKFIITFGAVSILSLVYVVASGKTVNGAAGWINLGIFNVQPAEISKIFLVLFMAQQVAFRENKELSYDSRYKRRFIYAVAVALPLFLILIEPDVGGFIINASAVLIIILASGYSIGITTLISVGGMGGLMLLLSKLKSVSPESGGPLAYMARRFVGFSDPFKYQQSSGQQLVNSYYALSNGGVFGAGLGNSIQKRGYLPEPYTDFILAITGEELGLLMVLFILILIFGMIGRIVFIGSKSKETFHTLCCYGIATFMTVQTVFNVGGISGILPITGVTFPFLSYGGSSMLILSFCVGLVLSISALRKKDLLNSK